MTRRFPALAAALLLPGLAGCDAAPAEPVVFGVAAPLTSAYGASMLLGAELARQEINRAGGIRGRPLELRAADDEANPTTAPAVAEAFYRDESVLAVVGHVNSGTMTAAASVYEWGLAAVATSATSPEISRLGDWIFRVATSDSANAVQLAELARSIDRPTAILYANDDYGRGLAQSFRAAFTARGGQILQMDPYLESTEDFSPFLRRLQRRGVGLVFVAGLEEGAARMIRQARDLGLRARFLGGDGLEGLKTMGPIFDGTMVGLLYHPDASPAAKSFAERFRDAHGREPDSFAALGYDATHLLARAAAEGGLSREAIRDHLASLGQKGGAPPHSGVTGLIRFDANGDPVEKGFAVGVLRGGAIVHNGQL